MLPIKEVLLDRCIPAGNFLIFKLVKNLDNRELKTVVNESAGILLFLDCIPLKSSLSSIYSIWVSLRRGALSSSQVQKPSQEQKKKNQENLDRRPDWTGPGPNPCAWPKCARVGARSPGPMLAGARGVAQAHVVRVGSAQLAAAVPLDVSLAFLSDFLCVSRGLRRSMVFLVDLDCLID